MKAAIISTAILCLVFGFVFGAISEARETTTLDEAINRTHSDREVVVFEDAKHGYVCYYRKTADGIACLPYNNRVKPYGKEKR